MGDQGLQAEVNVKATVKFMSFSAHSVRGEGRVGWPAGARRW